jgi:hypothetical protein
LSTNKESSSESTDEQESFKGIYPKFESNDMVDNEMEPNEKEGMSLVTDM